VSSLQEWKSDSGSVNPLRLSYKVKVHQMINLNILVRTEVTWKTQKALFFIKNVCKRVSKGKRKKRMRKQQKRYHHPRILW